MFNSLPSRFFSLTLGLLALSLGSAILPAGAQRGSERSALKPSPESLEKDIQAVIASISAATVWIDTDDGMGSGTIIDRQGHIVTAAHVVETAKTCVVSLADGRRFEGDILGVNGEGDVALLRIVAPGLRPARLGRSSDLKRYTWTIAAGHPSAAFNDFVPTVSIGVIHELDGYIVAGEGSKIFRSAIVTDVPISPGSSGGGLFDLEGRLVGINAAVTALEHKAFSVGIDEFRLDEARLRRRERFNRVALRREEQPRERGAARSRRAWFSSALGRRSRDLNIGNIDFERATGEVKRFSGVLVSQWGDTLVPSRLVGDLRRGALVPAKLPDGKSVRAKVLAHDYQLGVSLLRLPPKHRPYRHLALDKGTPARRGSLACALSGGRLEGGVVGAVDRMPPLELTGELYRGVLQLDLRLRKSAVGGPVVDRQGALLGMLVQSRLKHNDSNFVRDPYGAFVLPRAKLHESYLVLLRGENRERLSVGFLGVMLHDMTEEEKERRGVSRGVLVAPGSLVKGPAMEAGVRIGDVLHAIDGVNMGSKGEVIAAISRRQRGEVVRLDLSRRGESLSLKARVADRGDF